MELGNSREYFARIIKEKCCEKYPENSLPYFPWFLKECENARAKEVLARAFKVSESSIEKFSDLVGEELEKIHVRKMSEQWKLKALLEESAMIAEIIKKLNFVSKTKVSVKLVRYESEFDDISVTLQLGDEVKNLEVSESLDGYVSSVKNDVYFSVYTQTSDSPVKLDEVRCSLMSMIGEVKYQDLIGDSVYLAVAKKGSEVCKITLEITLSFSESDKKEILTQRLSEIDKEYLKEQENTRAYDYLANLLGVNESEIRSKRSYTKNRENCCGNCLVS